MSTFIHVYLSPDTIIEAHLIDGLVRISEGPDRRAVAVLVPPADLLQTVEACDKVITAFMDLRNRAATRLHLDATNYDPNLHGEVW